MQTANKIKTWVPWLNWSIAVAYVVLVFSFQTCYALINVQMAQLMSFSVSQIGLIGTTYTLCFALIQLFSGALLDRLGLQRVLPVACATLVVGLFVFANATSLTGFLVAQVLIAIGAAFGFIGAGFTGKTWFPPQNYGLMFSLVQFVASLAAFAGQILLSERIESLPYHRVIVALAIWGLAVLALMLLWLRDSPSLVASRQPIDRPAQFVRDLLAANWAVLALPGMWRLVIAGAISFGTMLSIGAVWGPKLLTAHGLTVSQANAATSFNWLGLAIGSPLIAWLGKRAGMKRVALSLGVLAQAACLIALLSLSGATPLMYQMLLLAWGTSAGASMLPFDLAAEKVSSSQVGSSASLVNGCQFVAGGVLMYLPGFLMDLLNISIHEALYVFPPMLVFAALFGVGWRRDHSQPSIEMSGAALRG